MPGGYGEGTYGSDTWPGGGTLLAAIADWLASDPTFAANFPGGLHYGGAPSADTATYPYIVMHQTDVNPQWICGRACYLEDVRVVFVVETDSATAADTLVRTLADLIFDRRGERQTPALTVDNGRVIGRHGSVGSIELAANLGLVGADVYPATIDSTWTVARDY